MKIRLIVAILALASTVASGGAVAQVQGKVYRVGYVTPGNPEADPNRFRTSLIKNLAQRGYVVGTNLMLESRGAQFQVNRLPGLLEELVASKVDVIVTTSYPAALAAKQGSGAVPVVAVNTGDPLGTRLIDSLARPGGNMTGVSDVAAELAPKRLELLKDLVPTLRRVAMLWNASDLGMTMRYQATATTAQALGLAVQTLGVREPDDFDDAFAAMTRDPPDAILMVSDALTNLNRKRVFEFAITHRLPAIYEVEAQVRDGGLMSYGPDTEEIFDRAASLVDRVLKGTKPANLPFEQPTHFRLVINLKAAKALGLNVPSTLLVAADEVIE
jgi:putative tryptophan/tyrosine transport system substrate-binding protein